MNRFFQKSFFIIFSLCFALAIVTGFQNCANVLAPKSGDGASMCPNNNCTGYLKKDLYYAVSSDTSNSYGATDILFVIDNSASMITDQQELAARFSNLASAINGLDYRIAITSTSFNSTQGQLKTLSSGQKIITPQTSNPEGVFQNSVVLGETGDDSERGIAAAIQAFRNNENSWIRKDSIFQVVVLSDEDECSFANRPNPANRTDFSNIVGDLNMYLSSPGLSSVEKNVLIEDMYNDYLTTVVASENTNCKVNSGMDNPQAFKNATAGKGVFHSIIVNDQVCRQAQLEGFWKLAADGSYTVNGQSVNPGYNIGHLGLSYAQLSLETGGVVGNICADNYSNQLDFIGDRISNITRSTFYLECTPVGAVNVILKDENGNPMLGITHTANGNALTFSQPLVLGTQINAEYYCAP